MTEWQKMSLKELVNSKQKLFTFKDLIAFANWYGDAVYKSEGNASNAVFCFKKFVEEESNGI